MITNNTQPTPEIANINIDELCQAFDGKSFYGLEYILEDFFQNNTLTTAMPDTVLDWLDYKAK